MIHMDDKTYCNFFVLSILLTTLSHNVLAFIHPSHLDLKPIVTQLNSFSSLDSDGPPMRFLGKGDRAVVRPGVVLIAPDHEYDHFLMRSAVFVHAIGKNDMGQHVTRGVIIDQPTAFNMGEMGGGSVYGVLAQNTLFQGGDVGNDSAMLLHVCGKDSPLSEEDEVASRIDGCDQIGMTGIYEGGLQTAMDLANDGLVDPEKFKFFFNYVEFTDVEMEMMMNEKDSDGDTWCSVEVSPRIILGNEYTRGQAWSYLRRQVRQMEK